MLPERRGGSRHAPRQVVLTLEAAQEGDDVDGVPLQGSEQR
jgi:hypothetical protein